ncbi:MAG: ATP-binding protein, partial [Acidimicrobiales bacterium]|nr:ATP-binding protein [Acidimicrobiales bacterium]
MPVQPLTPERFSARPIDDLADLSVVRREFAEWLKNAGVDHETADELLVVMSELGANAVRESPSEGRPPTVAAELDASGIHVDVANEVDVEAEQEADDRWDLDDPLRTGGRGLLV